MIFIRVYSIFLVLLLALVLSCKSDTQPHKALNTLENKLNSYSISDSLIIKEPSIFLVSKNESNLLFARFSNQDIIIYNELSKVFSKYNFFGDGPEMIKSPLSFNNLGFLKDTLFYLAGVNQVNLYGLGGNFVKKINVDRQSFAPIMHVHLTDSLLFGFNFPQGSTNTPSFYKTIHKLFFRYSTGKIDNFIDYPIEGHPISNETTYKANNYYFNVNYTDSSSLNLLFGTEPTVFQINLNQQKIFNKIPISPDFFKSLDLPFGKALSIIESATQGYTGSYFTLYKEINKTHYAFYTIPYSEEFMVEFVKTHKNFPFEEAPDIKFALIVFDKDGKKLRDDIVFPTSLGKPLLMDEDGIIYFMKNPTEDDEKKGQTVYYKVRLTDEDS